jgi:hypothetical protein
MSELKDMPEVQKHSMRNTLGVAAGVLLLAGVMYAKYDQQHTNNEIVRAQEKFTSAAPRLVSDDGMIAVKRDHQLWRYGRGDAVVDLRLDDNCELDEVDVMYSRDTTGKPTDITDYAYHNKNRNVTLHFKDRDDLAQALGEKPCAALLAADLIDTN